MKKKLLVIMCGVMMGLCLTACGDKDDVSSETTTKAVAAAEQDSKTSKETVAEKKTEADKETTKETEKSEDAKETEKKSEDAKETEKKSEASQEETTEKSQETTSVAEVQTGEEATGETLSESELRQLVDKNNYVNLSVYGLGDLPLEEGINYDEKTRYYHVREDVFKDYESFEKYIRSVYCKEEADTLLYNYPSEGVQKYVNISGKLFLDSQCSGGRGYYVDWSEYSIDITKSDAQTCDFTLTATVEWPADEPVKEPYTVQGTAVKENGVWVLKKMIS